MGHTASIQAVHEIGRLSDYLTVNLPRDFRKLGECQPRLWGRDRETTSQTGPVTFRTAWRADLDYRGHFARVLLSRRTAMTDTR